MTDAQLTQQRTWREGERYDARSRPFGTFGTPGTLLIRTGHSILTSAALNSNLTTAAINSNLEQQPSTKVLQQQP